MTGEHIAIDFESFYSPVVSVKKMGVREYLDHPDCEVYLVSAYDGADLWVACEPQYFNWDLLDGRLIVSHNANFDAQVFSHLQEKNLISKAIRPAEWNCTANLAAFLGAPRSLDGAAKTLFNAEVLKDVRHDMRGKRWTDLKPTQKERVRSYTCQDSKFSWQIWNQYAALWPWEERILSLITLGSCAYGIALDVAQLHQQLDILETQKRAALTNIPWVPAKPPLSRPAFDAACEVEGLTPPASLAMSSEECDAWMELYGDRYGWIGAMRDFRRANMLAAKIIRMLNRIRANGRMPYELKYFGAHTGRDSGSGKINLQNLPREPICGINLRSSIIASPGKKLIIADFRQIEARVLLFLVKDQIQLSLIHGGMSPYETHARTSMNWSGSGDYKKEAPRHYLLAKARVLALGYGAGWRKFNVMAYLPAYLGKDAKEIFAAPVTESQAAAFMDYLSKFEKNKATLKKWKTRDSALVNEWTNSWLIVQDFRAKNPKIIALWKHLDNALRAHAGDTYRIRLPSGRILQYRDVMVDDEHGATAVICRQGKMIRQKLYGGLLTENVVSAIARDILRDAAIRLHLHNFQIIMRVHDELVLEVSPNAPIFLIRELMAICPPWLKGCPIDVEIQQSERYLK
jgi:hypothetical protein